MVMLTLGSDPAPRHTAVTNVPGRAHLAHLDLGALQRDYGSLKKKGNSYLLVKKCSDELRTCAAVNTVSSHYKNSGAFPSAVVLYDVLINCGSLKYWLIHLLVSSIDKLPACSGSVTLTPRNLLSPL